MNGTQPRYSPAGRKMERAQCHHVLGYTSNSKVSLGFQDWKGLKSHQVQSSASRLTHRLPTAPKNQIPHELSTTRHWKVLPLIWPKSCLLQLGVQAHVLPLRVARWGFCFGSFTIVQTWFPNSPPPKSNSSVRSRKGQEKSKTKAGKWKRSLFVGAAHFLSGTLLFCVVHSQRTLRQRYS